MRKFIGSEYGSLDAFTLSEGEITQPAEGEVRLKVEATALGFVDGLIALGRYQIRPPLPYVPGDKIPAGLDATTAAAMLVDYQTAHYALFERGQLRSGETVLVLGATGG